LSVAVTANGTVPTRVVLIKRPGAMLPLQLTMAVAAPSSLQRKRAMTREPRSYEAFWRGEMIVIAGLVLPGAAASPAAGELGSNIQAMPPSADTASARVPTLVTLARDDISR
jgi:hypothetical protein